MTPPKWFFALGRFNNDRHDDKIGSIVEDSEDLIVAEVCGGVPNARENGYILAAAWELLEALKEVENHHIEINNRAGRPLENSITLRIVRAAIAKVEAK